MLVGVLLLAILKRLRFLDGAWKTNSQLHPTYGTEALVVFSSRTLQRMQGSSYIASQIPNWTFFSREPVVK